MMTKTTAAFPCGNEQTAVQDPQALRILADTRLLMARPAERAYDAGANLADIRDRKIYEMAGHAAFDAYLDAEGFKRSTAYSNMLLAQTFQRSDLALGVSKLRLLVQGKVADARALLRDGVPQEGLPPKPVAEFTFRELAEWVRGLPPAGKAPSPMSDATVKAIENLIAPVTRPESMAA